MTTRLEQKAIIAGMPLDWGHVSSSQVKLAFKRITGEALSRLDQVSHSAFMGNIPRLQGMVSHYKKFYEEMESRITPVNGPKAKIYNSSKYKYIHVVGITPRQRILLHQLEIDYQTPDGQLVKLEFGETHNTDYVHVSDGEDEHSLNISEKVIQAGVGLEQANWTIDTRFILRRIEKLVLNGFVLDTYIVPSFIGKIPTPRLSSRPETEAIIAAIAFDGPAIAAEKRTLINKIVSGVLLQSDEHDHFLTTDPEYKLVFEALNSRVHFFLGEKNVRLYDLTTNKRAGTTYLENGKSENAITLDGEPVKPLLTLGAGGGFDYGAPFHGRHVIIRDILLRNEVLIEFVRQLPNALEPTTSHYLVNLDRSNLAPLCPPNCQCGNGRKLFFNYKPVNIHAPLRISASQVPAASASSSVEQKD